MTPFASVAMLEKLALLKMAFCSAPVLINVSSDCRRSSLLIAGGTHPASVSSRYSRSRPSIPIGFPGMGVCGVAMYYLLHHDGLPAPSRHNRGTRWLTAMVTGGLSAIGPQ